VHQLVRSFSSMQIATHAEGPWGACEPPEVGVGVGIGSYGATQLPPVSQSSLDMHSSAVMYVVDAPAPVVLPAVVGDPVVVAWGSDCGQPVSPTQTSSAAPSRPPPASRPGSRGLVEALIESSR